MIYACTCPECEGQEEKINNITKPKHYQGKYGMEALEVVKNFIWDLAGERAYYWGNVIKYLLRFQQKNGVEDLKKARQNLDWLFEEMEEVK
ncbi:TPA: DUF3310 domain-containing protein [Streptococcus suis]|nr:DUF3310 domain-containing protein [Streptococcus suis]NQI39532.1 DUF3310 domain-containing protein [Streptococcus suis]NQI49433.1 DUF3310 domain-containing protein [Streptococcus suis]HEM2819912.1 DUF3310 domain-containing protein [Streptococcus suis]